MAFASSASIYSATPGVSYPVTISGPGLFGYASGSAMPSMSGVNQVYVNSPNSNLVFGAVSQANGDLLLALSPVAYGRHLRRAPSPRAGP